ncbi:MAG TPA: hypothetical protein VL523_15320 [Terriglobia bacterium]|nr:hypothetical protein [Terriglobia bacterium]
MLPLELQPGQFKGYPPEARQLAVTRIALLQQLPAVFVALLLREIIAYDWKFPAERTDLDRQLSYLGSLAPQDRQRLLGGFAGLRLSADLEKFDWVNAPGEYSERLTAHLWATHQIDAFHRAAVDYMGRVDRGAPEGPPRLLRLGIVVVGRGVVENKYPLFRKLRKQGVYFTRLNPEKGVQKLLDAVASRATAHPARYGHWYIDGGAAEAVSCPALTCVSYEALAPARLALLNRMEKAIQSGIGGPEALRTMIAELRPEDVGLKGPAGDAVLDHFQVSVLTQGSGTQIFSTTFVQWAAREALRRAQPLTLLARFAPRQRQRPMNEMLSGEKQNPALDPEGSLIDADMGAFYTWLNQGRLAGAERSSFLVWFEGHQEALAIAPALPRNTESDSSIDLKELVGQIT